jgi:prephenate dehydratase
MKKTINIGIQGGKGSFNEEAITGYLKKHKMSNHKITYLHTTENVLRALDENKIDQGQFAIHNTLGGIVMESFEAMAKHNFQIIDKYSIKIAHALIIRKDANLTDITTIMTHPQVLAQCKTTLAQKYPKLKLASGEGDLIDSALVAEQLSEGNLPKNIATMGSKVLAEIYDLQIVEDNLQDRQDNCTTFLLVKKMT